MLPHLPVVSTWVNHFCLLYLQASLNVNKAVVNAWGAGDAITIRLFEKRALRWADVTKAEFPASGTLQRCSMVGIGGTPVWRLHLSFRTFLRLGRVSFKAAAFISSICFFFPAPCLAARIVPLRFTLTQRIQRQKLFVLCELLLYVWNIATSVGLAGVISTGCRRQRGTRLSRYEHLTDRYPSLLDDMDNSAPVCVNRFHCASRHSPPTPVHMERTWK